MAAMSRQRTNLSPAFIASALAHAALVAATIIAWPWLSKEVTLGKVVPVTLVTSGPPAEMSPAVQAPTPAPAMAEQPTPEAPPEPAPVTPQPPTPEPTPSKAKASVAPKSAAAPSKPAKTGLDLDALLASVAASNPRASTRETSGLQGANRARADVSAQTGKGTDTTMSASEIGAFVSKLEKLWNPNCQVEGAAGVNVRVHIRLTPQGWLAAPPELADRGDIQSSRDPMLIAAAQRALSAVGRGAPYVELNPQHYASWREMIVNFDAKKACAQ